MRAIIPVAGVGSRLKPHTHTLPKVLLNVGGKPILGHILDRLISEGIEKATFIYGHLGEMIIQYVKTSYPQLRADFIEQPAPEGLGQAIYLAIPTFDDEELFIILGDTLFDVDLKTVFSKKTSALGVKYVFNPSRFGVAIIENDIITKLIEKPKEIISNMALVGLYYITNRKLLKESLERIVRENIRTNGEYQLTDALQLMIEAGEKMSALAVEGWYDCGKPETLLETNRYLLENKNNTPSYDNTIIVPPVFIDPSAKIINSIIGPYATVGANAELEHVIIENTIVGANAEIKKVILKDSIIGTNSVIIGSHKKMNSGDSTEIEFN